MVQTASVTQDPGAQTGATQPHAGNRRRQRLYRDLLGCEIDAQDAAHHAARQDVLLFGKVRHGWLVYPHKVESEDLPSWACTWCGGAAEDEESLLEHQEWCLGDAVSNTKMLAEVDARDGELTQEALVAEAIVRRRPPLRGSSSEDKEN